MLKINSFVRAAACAAGIPLLMPFGALKAGELPVVQSAQRVASDIILTEGALTGQYLTSAGTPVDGAEVAIRQGGKEIARTTTDTKGVFKVSNVRSGVYEVAAGNQIELVRAWETDAAPPTAQRYATVVAGTPVRGDLGDGGLVACAALVVGIAALTVGIIALNEADHDHSH